MKKKIAGYVVKRLKRKFRCDMKIEWILVPFRSQQVFCVVGIQQTNCQFFNAVLFVFFFCIHTLTAHHTLKMLNYLFALTVSLVIIFLRFVFSFSRAPSQPEFDFHALKQTLCIALSCCHMIAMLYPQYIVCTTYYYIAYIKLCV